MQDAPGRSTLIPTVARPSTGTPRLPNNRRVSHSSTVDPPGVTEPVVRALDTLIVAAVASFALSVMAVLATVLAADGAFHAVAHLSLPGLMGIVIVARCVHRLRRPAASRDDAWTRAGAIDPSDTRLARVLSIAVPLAWLVGSVGILLRHGLELHGHTAGVGVLLPLSAALWILATFAWTDACRDRVAAGIDESDRNFRAYWRDVGRAQ